MIEIFRTNVTENAADQLVNQLMEHCPQSLINFDLEDCDKILRIEGDSVPSSKIIELLQSHGFYCDILI